MLLIDLVQNTLEMDIIALYHKYIYDRYHSLLKSGKKDFDNKDLSKIFEYYTAIKLSEQYGQLFYEYNDIDPNFKELNQMSKNDSGVDLCNLIDTIVQCKLRKQHLNWGECSTFFASQNIFNYETNLVEIKWPKLIIARNSECKLSCNLSIKNKLFTDITYDRDELLEFCSSLFGDQNTLFTDLQDTSYPFDLQKAGQKIILEKEECIIPKEEIILRDYQIECIELIRSDKNVIIQLPTGCGKNVIITQHIIQRLYSKCDGENTKPLKFLILVPRIILMEQIRDEFMGLNLPDILDSIQIIGDGNTEFNEDKLITICVYNSIDKIDDFAQFEKIFIDEAHHIIKPEIYYNEEDTNSEYNSDDEYLSDENYLSDEEYNLEEEIKECNSEEEIKECNSEEEIKECNSEVKIQEQYLSKIKKLKKYNNNVFLSATIDQIDEYEYYSKDIRDMINDGYLCDYNIHIPIFSGNIDSIKSDTNVCKHLIQNYRNIIIYCNTKKEGIEINKIMNELLPLCSEYIDCDTTKKNRNIILSKFKSGEIPFLINVRILVEGFNAPITKGVCFLHMPSSKTAIIQIIGRALRLHDQKIIANIILPFSNTEDEKDINNFLKILTNNDVRIKQSYDKKKLGGYISPSKIELDNNSNTKIIYEDSCEFRFTKIYNNISSLMNNEEIWMQNLQALKDYINKFKDIPRNSNDKKIKTMINWARTQKQNYKNKQYIMKNQIIYDKWTEFINDQKYKNNKKYLITNEDIWNTNLLKLTNYIDTFNKRPSSEDKDEQIMYLGRWVLTQVRNYNNEDKTMKHKINYDKWTEFINNEKYEQYFISNEDAWNNKLFQVSTYMNNFNKRPSYADKDKHIRALGKWITRQCTIFNKKEDIMKNEIIYNKWHEFINDERYSVYFGTNEEKWMRMLNSLKKYLDDNEKIPSYKNDKVLYKWQSRQKDHYNANKCIMKDENIKKIWKQFIDDEKYKKYLIAH